MTRLLLVISIFSFTVVAKPYRIECSANRAPVGKNWLVNATLEGTVDRGRSEATLENLEGTLAIFQKGVKESWAETNLNKRTLSSDSYYHPVKYKNHFRFELSFDENDSFNSEKVDFLLPKLFEVDRANRAYFILNHINDTFGGTIALRCNVMND